MVVFQILIPDAERVVLPELKIGARAYRGAALRRGEERLIGTGACKPRGRNSSRDSSVVIYVSALGVQEETAMLAQWPADVPSEELRPKGRIHGKERVARIPNAVADRVVALAMKLIGAGFSKDLDPPVSQLVELRRERVRIDADLANRFLGGNRPPVKPSI